MGREFYLIRHLPAVRRLSPETAGRVDGGGVSWGMDALETLEPRTAVCHPARLFLGLVIFLIASSFLNDRLDWTGIHLHVSVWPWILVLLGLAKMGDRRADGLPGLNRVAAALLFLGIWGLVNEYRIFDVSYRRSWPLLLIGAGVLLIVRSQEPPAAESAGDGR